MQSAPQALTLSAAVIWQRPWRFCSPEATCPERVPSSFTAAEKSPHGASRGGLNPAFFLPLRHTVRCGNCTPGRQTSRFQSFVEILLHKAPPPSCQARHWGRHMYMCFTSLGWEVAREAGGQ